MTVDPTWLPPYCDESGKPVTLTADQIHAVWRAVQIWQRVYFDAKGEHLEFTQANLQKSCLLGRLLRDGKPPLPNPPPLAYSAPWYSLIENGRAQITARDIYAGYDGYMLICQDRWEIVSKSEHDEQWALTHRNTGEVRWLLRPITSEDEPQVCGQRRGIGDTWEPTYYDMILERM